MDDPKLALSLYARVMRREEGERERLRALVEGADMGTETIGHPAPAGAHIGPDRP